MGRSVALAEERELGGECFWAGCVPTKAMVRAAQIWHTVRHASKFGIEVKIEKADFADAMRYKARAVQQVRHAGDAGAFPRADRRLGASARQRLPLRFPRIAAKRRSNGPASYEWQDKRPVVAWTDGCPGESNRPPIVFRARRTPRNVRVHGMTQRGLAGGINSVS